MVVAVLTSVSTRKPRNAPTASMPAVTAPAAHTANWPPPIEKQAATMAVTIIMLGSGQKLIPPAQQPRRNESKSRFRRSALRPSGERRAAT